MALSKFLHALSLSPAFPPGMGCLPGLEEEEGVVLWGDLCLEPLAPPGAALFCHGSSGGLSSQLCSLFQ